LLYPDAADFVRVDYVKRTPQFERKGTLILGKPLISGIGQFLYLRGSAAFGISFYFDGLENDRPMRSLQLPGFLRLEDGQSKCR